MKTAIAVLALVTSVVGRTDANGLSRKPGVKRSVVAETLPMLLRNAGYKTIHVGKAYFAADRTPSEDPCELGFDVNIAGHCAGAPGSYQGTKNLARKGGSIVDVPGPWEPENRFIAKYRTNKEGLKPKTEAAEGDRR